MSTAIQRRRGNTAQHANFTGLAGEITIDTDLSTVIVHDGSTAGGIRLAKYSEVQSASEGDITAVNTNAGSGLTGGTASGAANIAIDYENLQGNLVPSVDNTYSLGTADKVWKDVFVGPGSLYVNGQKVLEDNSGTITVGADAGQNLALNTTGGGDIEFNAVGSGTIAFKSNVTIATGKSISLAGGGAIPFAGNINVDNNSINNLADPVASSDAATKNYVDNDATVVRVTGNQTIAGEKTISDDLTISGNLTVAGAITTVNSETISLADNIIDLNSNFTTGSPTENAGLRIQRGDETASQLRWNEASDYWEIVDGSGSTKIALDTDDLAEGSSNLYFTDARAISAISAGGDLSYDSATGVVSFTERTDAEVRGLISVTDAGGDGSLSYDDSTGVITYTGPGATETRAHFNAGDGVTITDGEVAVDSTVVRTSGAQTVAGVKTFTDGVVVNGNLTVSGAQTILNTETLTVDDNIIVLNNNVTGAPTENSGIAVERGTSDNAELRWNETSDEWEISDGTAFTKIALSTTDLAEGTNLYHTDARARAAISASGDLNYNSSTGMISFTDRTDSEVRGLISASGDLSYNGTTGVMSFTQRTDAEVRGLISVTDTGGDGSLVYDNTTGVITYTGPSASEVRAHFSGGTGVSISSGSISIGQSVGTSDDVTFNSVTADLTGAVTGTVSSLSNHDTDDVAEGVTNLYFTTSRARQSVSGGTGISYNSTTGVISLTDTGYVTGVTAGTGLSGGGTSGTVTLNVGGLTVAEFNGSAIQTGAEAFSDSDTVLMTAAAVQDKILGYGYTTNIGDITGVTAGTGLSGGGASGSVTLNVSGLTVAEFNGSAIQTSGEAFSDSDAVLMTAAAANDRFQIAGSYQAAGSYVTTSSAQALRATDAIQVSNDTITIFKGDGTSEAVSISDATLSTEQVQDIAGGMIVGAGATSVSYNDTAGTITITSTDTNTNTTYSAGTDLSLSGTTFNVQSSTTATANSLAKRDGSGNLTADTFIGTSTSARYADLAEKYATDAQLDAGTVVVFGGAAEVTACSSDAHHAVAGVISTDPAYMMNSEAEGQYVALTGRVPVKVTGPVAKGDLMVTSGVAGHAKADNNAQAGRILGKAISAHQGEGEGVVEVLITLM